MIKTILPIAYFIISWVTMSICWPKELLPDWKYLTTSSKISLYILSFVANFLFAWFVFPAYIGYLLEKNTAYNKDFGVKLYKE